MLTRGIWALLFVPACTFSTDLPGEDEEPSDQPAPTPAVRCQGTGLTMCVDFEDMPLPQDGMTPGVAIASVMVVPKDRGIEKAAEFSPMSSVVIADAPKLDLQALSIEMWVKPAVVPANGGDKQNGLFEAQLQYAMNFEADRQFECMLWGTGDSDSDNVDSASIATVGVWHHVACTYDGAMLKIYVDGKLEGCQPTNRVVAIDGSGATIGANIASGPTYKNKFIGQLDNVHLYSGALSGASVCTLAGGGANCTDQCPSTSNEGGGFGGLGDWHD